jgi:hypothetical protein
MEGNKKPAEAGYLPGHHSQYSGCVRIAGRHARTLAHFPRDSHIRGSTYSHTREDGLAFHVELPPQIEDLNMPKPRTSLRSALDSQRQALWAARECLRDCVFLDGADAATILSTLSLVRTALEHSATVRNAPEADNE